MRSQQATGFSKEQVSLVVACRLPAPEVLQLNLFFGSRAVRLKRHPQTTPKSRAAATAILSALQKTQSHGPDSGAEGRAGCGYPAHTRT